MMKLRNLCSCVPVAILGASLIASAQTDNRIESLRDGQNVSRPDRPRNVVQANEGESLRINTELTEDGQWRIVGVVGLGKDLMGRTVITVKKDGDPVVDMVLTLRVPVYELADGTRVAGGIDSVRINKDTVALTIRDSGDGVGAIAGDSIFIGGCEGAANGGDFVCLNLDCHGVCGKFKIGTETFCKCNPVE